MAEPVVTSFRAHLNRDFVLAVVLALLAGCASYTAQLRIDSAIFDCGPKESTWFHADTTIHYQKMLSRGNTQWSDNAHPLFSVLTVPAVYVFKYGFGFEGLTAVRSVVACLAAAWTVAFFALFRVMGLVRVDAVCFTLLATSSAAAMFWWTVPETYGFASLTVLLALLVVACAERWTVSAFWYVTVSALTLGLAVTHWFAGTLAAFLHNTWQRTLQISVNALCIVLVVWDLKKHVFPNWQREEFFFYLPNERADASSFESAGGILAMPKSFFLHSMIMPDFAITDRIARPDDWPIMLTQAAGPGSGSEWGVIAVGVWALLLAMGAWALVTIKDRQSIRVAVGAMILFQLALHSVWLDEVFNFAIHFLPLLVTLAAMAALTSRRRIALVLCVLLIPAVAANNILQFLRAAESAQCIP